MLSLKFLILILFFIVLNIITLNFLPSIKAIGVLRFKSDHISLLNKNISLEDIERVHIIVNNCYYDRAGSPNSGIGNSASLSGSSNNITIKTKENTQSYSFQVKYLKEIEVLKKIAENYKIKGLNILYIYRKKRLV